MTHSVRDFCKGNYCIWLGVKRTACNFLMACRDTDVKLVILTEIRACWIRRGCKIQIISFWLLKTTETVVLFVDCDHQTGQSMHILYFFLFLLSVILHAGINQSAHCHLPSLMTGGLPDLFHQVCQLASLRWIMSHIFLCRLIKTMHLLKNFLWHKGHH